VKPRVKEQRCRVDPGSYLPGPPTDPDLKGATFRMHHCCVVLAAGGSDEITEAGILTSAVQRSTTSRINSQGSPVPQTARRPSTGLPASASR